MFSFLRKTALWILLAPYAIIGVGAASNQLCLISNGDRFPVLVNQHVIDEHNAKAEAAIASGDEDYPQPIGPDGMIDKIHCVMNNKTHLNALGDIFDLQDAWYSVGDGLLFFGSWLMGFTPFVWLFVVVDKLRA